MESDSEKVRDEVLEYIRQLKCGKQIDVKTNALQKLTDLSSRHEFVREIIVDENGTKHCLDLLQSKNTKAQSEAARLIRALAFKSDKNKIKIAKEGGIKPLVKMLLWSTSDIEEDDEVKKSFRSSDGDLGPKPVAPHRKPKSDRDEIASLQKDIAAALCNLATEDENAVIVVKEGATPALISLLKSKNEDVLSKAASAMWNLGFIKTNRETIIKEGGIEPLLDLLKVTFQKDSNSSPTVQGNVQGIAAGALCLLTLEESARDEIERELKIQESILRQNLKLSYASMGRFKVHDKTIAPLVEVLHRNRGRIYLQWLAARAIHFLALCATYISVVVSQKGVISDLIDMSLSGGPLAEPMAKAVLEVIAQYQDSLWVFDYSLASTYSTDMLKILNNPKFSDFQIKIDDKIIFCHKVVLEARCPEILKLVTQTDQMSQEPQILSIQSEGVINYNLMVDLMEWIYTGDMGPILKRNKEFEGDLRQLALQLELNSVISELSELLLGDCPYKKSNRRLASALDSLKYSDVVFNVQGESVLAHRAILYARCTHFCHMFDSGMIESFINQITIPEEPSTFKHMLRYLYSDQVEESVISEELAMLLFLANAYNIPRLVEICEVNLKDEIDKDNVAIFLPLADQHQAKRLFHYCIGEAAKNWDSLKKSKDFKKQVNKELREYVRKMHKFLKVFVLKKDNAKR